MFIAIIKISKIINKAPDTISLCLATQKTTELFLKTKSFEVNKATIKQMFKK